MRIAGFKGSSQLTLISIFSFHLLFSSPWLSCEDLAAELLKMFTARKMGKVFFTNSGSEANDTQVKLVWYYNNALGRPEKKKFIARKKSYHGSTLVSASLTGLPALHQKFDLPVPFVLHTDCPHYWRSHLPGETEEEFATRLARNLEDLILKEGPETIAAFIAEPVMGAGGVIPPPATYFDKVQAVVKKYDILFIADEVVCAFGRLGTMFGCDKYNIKPDLVSLAKAPSAAYMPIGAVLVSPEIADVIHTQSDKLGSFSHGFTYSGHPVACAVALEALKIYQERNIAEQVQKLSPMFQNGIKAFSNCPIIGEIRGTGLIIGTEFVDNKSPTDFFPPEWGVGTIFGQECQKRGMLAEQLAKQQRLKIWENYVEGQDTGNSSDVESKRKEVLKVVVTEVLTGSKFYIQIVEDSNLASVQQQIASLNLQEVPVIGSFNPKKGECISSSCITASTSTTIQRSYSDVFIW